MKLNYRPEIDGLRAIAVLAVVLNHANPNFLKSGFLGVDIFFVISGYLITQIIYREIQNNEFSFLEFYKRRAKRILPALLVILLVTTLTTYFLFLPEDFFEYNKSVFASLLFSANLFFARGVGYFDTGNSEKPLLHIWSLSVEEQFYFVFPIILILAWKYRKHQIIHLIIALITLSLILHWAPTFGLESHYLPHLRAYELLIGALFAVLPPKALSPKILWLALIAIFVSLIIEKNSLSSGGVLEKLIICLATGLILFNQNSNNSVNHLLSVRFLVFFGLISYSLYLWHWVIFAQIRYVLMDDKIPYLVLIIAIFVVIGLSYLSYHFVEQPIRKIKNFSIPKFTCSLIFYFSFAVLSFFFFKSNKNLSIKNDDYYSWENSNICNDKINLNLCTKGDLSQKPKILVIGDSHAGQYNRFFDLIGKKEGWSADVISASGCAYTYDSKEIFTNMRSEIKNCKILHEYIENNLNQYQKIIIVQYFFLYFKGHQNFQKEWINSLSKLKNNKEIYIFADNYLFPFKKTMRYIKYSPYFNYKEIKIIENKTNLKVKKIIQENFPNIHWIDINHLIPEDGKINGIFIYRDSDHFSPYGAEKLAERFIESGAKLIQ